jgi:hypothetical protein
LKIPKLLFRCDIQAVIEVINNRARINRLWNWSVDWCWLLWNLMFLFELSISLGNKFYCWPVISFSISESQASSSGALPRTNCNSRPVFKHLSKQVLHLLRHSLSPYATRSYRHSWKLLLRFYQRVALTLPLSVYNVYNCICYLFGRAYSPSTIVSYISAISYIHKMDIQDPTTSFLIRKLLKGRNNLQPNRDCRLPITKDILIKILNSLNPFIPKY